MGCVPSMRLTCKPSNPPEPQKEVRTDNYCSPPSNGAQMGSRISHEKKPVNPGCNAAGHQIPSGGADLGGCHSKTLQPSDEEVLLGRGDQQLIEEPKTCAKVNFSIFRNAFGNSMTINF